MPTLSSRRLPWPWDARLAMTRPAEPGRRIGDFRGTTIGAMRTKLIGSLRPRGTVLGDTKGFMLLPQADSSLLIGKKQTNLEALYPATAEYDSAPVYRERTFMFRPTGGLGEATQSSAGDRRYHYGINVWVSGGLFGKGPLKHPITFGATGVVRRFIEAPSSTGPLAIYILVASGVYERSDDSSSGQILRRSKPGWSPTDAARFTGAYSGALDALYVAWGSGELEQYTSGGTWLACALPSGFSANLLEVVGNELWAADSARSVIRKCEGDPKLAGSWSGPIAVGNPSSKITAIRQSNSRLVIFKDDGGVFTINADGSDNDLFPGLRTTPNADNGRTAWAWLDALWFRMGRAYYQLEMPSAQLRPAGPGRNLSNASEVQGPVQAWCGWNTQMAFAGIYNSRLGHSYLLSYGNWIAKAEAADSGSTVAGSSYEFADQYDGALVRWKSRQITSLFVSNIPTEARLYAGFADGGYDWILLNPYPLTPGSTPPSPEYTNDESYLVMPLHHAMFQADKKHWTGVSIFGPQMPVGSSVFVRYRLKGGTTNPQQLPTGDFLPFGAQPMTQIGERVDAEQDRQIAGQAIELKIEFNSSGTTNTPVLEGLGLHERLVPRFRRDYTLTANANDYIARRDGASVRQSGVQIREFLEQAAAAPASISLLLPDERINDVAIFSYEEHQVPHSQRGGLGWAITMQATQFTTRDVYGIIARLRGTRIGDLRGYLISDLRYM